MPSRRDFLKIAGSSVIGAAGAKVGFWGCASGMTTYRGQVINDSIEIVKSKAEQLKKPNGVLMVSAHGYGAIILRTVPEHGLIALLSRCTHRGCEVRPLPNGYACPCHGSEYDKFGDVLEGPANTPLQRFNVRDDGDAYVIELRSKIG